MLADFPQVYEIEIPDVGAYRLFQGGLRCKFSKPASIAKCPKLYTVSAANALIYVGVASQSMSSRLSFGFRAKGEGGYHGYKWKPLRHRLELSVWTVDQAKEPGVIRDLQTIEAEVAFLCRQASGQWPTYQHEIHFFPSGLAHRRAAAHIYAHAVRQRL